MRTSSGLPSGPYEVTAMNTNGTMLLLQALGAAMRGESPQAFMKRLANTHPQLKRMNLDDLYASAQQLCEERGLDAEDVAKNIDPFFGPK